MLRGGRLTRLLWCGVVGPPLFVAIALVEGSTRPGYSQWRHFVSDLALSDEGWMQVVNFIVYGVLSLGFAIGFRRALGAGLATNITTGLLVVYGLALITAGIFVTDPNLGYPRGAADTHTTHGLVHGLSGLVVFASVAVAALVMARQFAKDPRWSGWALYSIATGVLIPVCFVASNVVSVMDASGTLPNGPTGLFQRIAILLGWGWLVMVAVHLLRSEQNRAPANC